MFEDLRAEYVYAGKRNKVASHIEEIIYVFNSLCDIEDLSPRDRKTLAAGIIRTLERAIEDKFDKATVDYFGGDDDEDEWD